MSADEKVLVYHYRGEETIIKKNKGQMSTLQLQEILENHPNLQVTSKTFDPAEGTIEIRQNDLYTPAQKELYKVVGAANWDANLVGIVFTAEECRNFSEIHILSKKKD